MRAQSLALWLVLGALLATGAGGCGGDDEEDERPAAGGTTSERAETRERTEAPEPTESERTEQAEPTPPRTEEEEGQPRSSPEDEPGGAGDEEPARSQALFTGTGGKITPRVVRVPPFIAIRVTLRATDGQAYGLRFGSDGLATAGQQSRASTTLDGLRPGEAVEGRPFGMGNRVRIEATAEPGP